MADETTEYPVHKGGPHWVLSNGDKVQGSREDADAAEAALATDEPVADDADVVEEEVVADDVDSEDDTPVGEIVTREYAADTDGVADDSEHVIIKMTTNNVRKQIIGYNFTRANPFEVVHKDDVEHFLSLDGFERATPEQVERFYN